MKKNKLIHLGLILVLLGLVIAFFWPFIKGNLSFVWDTREFGYTYFHEVTKNVSKFLWPVWNSKNFSGYPFGGDIESSMFYPVQWVFAFIFGPIQFSQLVYYFIFHFFLGGVFAYLLGYKLTKNIFSAFLGAVVFMFSGYALGHISHMGQVTMYMWIPAVFLAYISLFEKKKLFYALLAGLTFGLSILVGHFNTSVYILLGLCVLFVFNLMKDSKERKKSIVCFLISMIFAGMISAISILPVQEFAFQSNRASLTYEQQSNGFSLNPRNLIGFILPNINHVLDEEPLRNFTGSVDITQNYLYIGILPLLLAGIAFVSKNKYKWFFVTLGLIGLLAAFGKYTPINFVLFKTFPAFNKARQAVQIMCIFYFSAAMMVAIGTEKVFEWLNKNKKLAIAVGMIICLIATGDIFYHGFNKRFYSQEINPGKIFDTADDLKLTSEIKSDNSLFRISDEKNLILPNKWERYDIENVWGLSGIKIKKYNDLFDKLQRVNAKPIFDNLYDFLNVKYIFSNRDLHSPHFKKVKISDFDVYINQNVLARAYLVSEYIVEPNPEKQLALIKNGKIDFKRQVILSKNPNYYGDRNVYSEKSEVKILEKTPFYMKIEVKTPDKSILVLSETDYNGWNLNVDGRSEKYLTANYTFRAVPLNPGKHIIEFDYRPWSVYFGAILSALSLVIFVIALFKFRKMYKME